MYRISQLMSTPVAIWPVTSWVATVPLTAAPETPLTGSHFPCRRSPRLLTNGYYVWTEDSFLCDEDGNITLSPPQTSVMYKENVVRIFRKKKRIRRSFSHFFKLGAPKSWLHGSVLGDVDSSSSEDFWLEEASRLDTHHRREKGADFDCSLTNNWESELPNAESVNTSASGHVAAQPPRKNSHESPLSSQSMASDHLQGDIVRLSNNQSSYLVMMKISHVEHLASCATCTKLHKIEETRLLGEVSFPTVLLAACLIISACARWFLGGILASVFTCFLVVTIACLPNLTAIQEGL